MIRSRSDIGQICPFCGRNLVTKKRQNFSHGRKSRGYTTISKRWCKGCQMEV